MGNQFLMGLTTGFSLGATGRELADGQPLCAPKSLLKVVAVPEGKAFYFLRGFATGFVLAVLGAERRDADRSRQETLTLRQPLKSRVGAKAIKDGIAGGLDPLCEYAPYERMR